MYRYPKKDYLETFVGIQEMLHDEFGHVLAHHNHLPHVTILGKQSIRSAIEKSCRMESPPRIEDVFERAHEVVLSETGSNECSERIAKVEIHANRFIGLSFALKGSTCAHENHIAERMALRAFKIPLDLRHAAPRQPHLLLTTTKGLDIVGNSVIAQHATELVDYYVGTTVMFNPPTEKRKNRSRSRHD